MKRAILIVLASLLIAGNVRADELLKKAMEYFVGDWTAEYKDDKATIATMRSDARMNPAGDTLIEQSKWTASDNSWTMKIFFFTKPGPSGGTFERLIVSDDGSHNTSRGGVEKDGDFFKMNAKESGLTSKGEPTTQEVAITVHDKDSYSITLHNGMTAGKPNPKIELRLHRMPTPDDYLRFFTPFMGDYTVKCKIGDNVADSTWSGRLSSTGRGFVCKGGAVLQYAAFETVDGYDPSTKKWKSSGITGTGEHGVTFLETDAASLRGKAATFQMEQTLAKPDGSTETWKGDWVFELGESGFTLVCKNLTMNGAKQPDEEYSYTPVKK